MATRADGEPLDLTAEISPGQSAELREGQSKPGEDQALDGSTMAAIFNRAVEVLRNDKHLISRRSNTEPSQGPRCPTFSAADSAGRMGLQTRLHSPAQI